jgi:hypothetical protein
MKWYHYSITYKLELFLSKCASFHFLYSLWLYIFMDKNLSWCTHIEQLIPKLNKASYAIRFLRLILSLETVRMVYYSVVHSVMSYGIIFWGGSTHSKTIFKIQKRIIRIITNSGSRVSCRNLFKKIVYLTILV